MSEKSQASTETEQRQPPRVREGEGEAEVGFQPETVVQGTSKDSNRHRAHGTPFPSPPGHLENTPALPQLTVVSFI